MPRQTLVTLLCAGVFGAVAASARSIPVEAAATPVVTAHRATAQPPSANKYGEVCAACHQAAGTGLEGVFPPLAGSEWVTGRVQLPIAIVLHGLQGEVVVKGKTYNSAMAPWASVLSDAEIAATLTYVRSQWGNRAGPVTAAQVRAVRTRYSTRTTPWTVAELQGVR
jgi:mono/diheme cytochrome c family protein